MSLSVKESKMSRMEESAGTEKKENGNPDVIWAGRSDTDKDNCRLNGKHFFSQIHAAAVKSHKDTFFQ